MSDMDPLGLRAAVEAHVPLLTASLVTYCPERELLLATLQSFSRASVTLAGWRVRLYVIDNTLPADAAPWLAEAVAAAGAELIAEQGNVGFGCAHNLVLDRVGDLHLILNPDLEMAEDALIVAAGFMEMHPECGLLSPSAFWGDGKRQYLCKRKPALFDLILRGFAPAPVKRLFAARLRAYEMQDLIADKVVWDVPIVSGCFMLFRGAVLRKLGGFNSRYFLYFEDFDLSLRTALVSRIAYVPSVRAIHHGGHAARKGWRHVWMFAKSARLFASTYGWRLW